MARIPSGGSMRVHPLIPQAAGAAAWGLFFSTAPYDGALLLAAIAWVPILIWAERRRTRRHGFLPGALVRIAVVGIVLLGAYLAPLTYVERRVPPLGVLSATLREVDSLHAERTGRAYPRLFAILNDSMVEGTVVDLPTRALPRGEFLSFIGAQLGLEHRVAYEGGFTSVAHGPHPLFIGWREKTQR